MVIARMSQKQKESKKDGTTPAAGENQDRSGLYVDVKKTGYLKKLKTMKKKFFVLKSQSACSPAKLEYYDTEKKWRAGALPKRNIVLKTCFNINRKFDARHKFVIALYTKDDCLGLVANSQVELEEWLTALLELQHYGSNTPGDSKPKPYFEHIYQVIVKPNTLKCSKNITGQHWLCLTTTSLNLVRMNSHSDQNETVEFPLMSIRRCGHTDSFFFMEVGRSAITGAGELWMQAEDKVVAQNMHETILGAMKLSKTKDELGPIARPRSASTSENSKPISSRRHGGALPYQTQSMSLERTPVISTIRERCDSMPARARTTSENYHDFFSSSPQSGGWHSSPSCANHRGENLRLQSAYARAKSSSPPDSANISLTGAYSTDSVGSEFSTDEYEGSPSDFHFGRYIHSAGELGLHTEPPITEEMPDDYLLMEPGQEDLMPPEYLEMGTSTSQRSSLANMSLNLSFSSSVHSIGSNPISPLASGTYLDMTSPSTASIPASSEYIPMSPGKYLPLEQLLAAAGSSHCSSIDSEQPTIDSSTADISGGYLLMAPKKETYPKNLTYTSPGVAEEGYLKMGSMSSSLPKPSSQSEGYIEMASPKKNTQSLQDVTFQTIPTFTEQSGFHLDKVRSYFSPSEHDLDGYIKPVRAYSIGSRPQKSHLGSHLDQCRVRAFSVGSQVTRVASKIQGTAESELGTLRSVDEIVSKKFSSAPLLPSIPWQARSSANKGGYSEDLMEMDYNPAPKVEVTTDQEQTEPIKKYSIGSSRQRSNSRSSSGASPMSSLAELAEKPEHKDSKLCEEVSRKGNTLHVVSQRRNSLDSSEVKQVFCEDGNGYVCMSYGDSDNGSYAEVAAENRTSDYLKMTRSDVTDKL
ncbi:insulin receptor substrate 1-like isoform X1 [Limulus polyphemus]|uniref:Insulin receptor substrate 1 n=2 Tax=Limulus polyphemus TaxID=6850 RepID=A0ABM1B699_LIMPO|nr:insulin receptor substrate 1-like isoform X1 [Limulus polyphemus]